MNVTAAEGWASHPQQGMEGAGARAESVRCWEPWVMLSRPTAPSLTEQGDPKAPAGLRPLH